MCVENQVLSHKPGRIRWLGHAERMSEERTVKRVFKNIAEGKMSVGKTREK
jgi:hypothetical protein